MFAFDSDALVYATQAGNPLGDLVAELFEVDAEITPIVGIGSVVLIPETLIYPTRHGAVSEVTRLLSFYRRLDLIPVSEPIASRAVALGAKYGLKAMDAIHLATAITTGASAFLTNNKKDFPRTITEITIKYPSDLATERIS